MDSIECQIFIQCVLVVNFKKGKKIAISMSYIYLNAAAQLLLLNSKPFLGELTLLKLLSHCVAASTIAAVCMIGANVNASPIQITSVSVANVVVDSESGPVIDTAGANYSNTQDTVAHSISAVLGQNSSATGINFQGSPSSQLFDFSFAHTVAAGFGLRAASAGAIRFLALEDATFSLAGSYSAFFEAQNARMNVRFREVSPGPVLFDQSERVFLESSGTTKTLTVGALNSSVFGFGGNTVSGDVIGSLVAGTNYELSFGFEIENQSHCASSGCIDYYSEQPEASAAGDLSFTITASSVPEPTSSILLLLGVVGLVSGSRKSQGKRG